MPHHRPDRPAAAAAGARLAAALDAPLLVLTVLDSHRLLSRDEGLRMEQCEQLCARSRRITQIVLGQSRATSLALPVAGQAAGLTGAFAPENWVLTNTNEDQTIPSPGYTCAALSYDVACVTINDPVTGFFAVIGSAVGFAGGDNAIGALTTERTTTWKLVNSGLPAEVSFKWLFSNGDNGTDIASFLLGSSETILSDVPTIIAAQVSNLIVPTMAVLPSVF